MKPRLVAIYLCLIAAPLIALSWLGFRVVESERRMIGVRLDELLIGRLGEVRERIAQVVEERQRDIVKRGPISSLDPAQLREMSRDSSAVRQYFVLDANGGLIYPNPLGELTKEEDEFLQRTYSVWERKEIPGPTAESTLKSLKAAQSVGWHTGYWDRALRILVWWREDKGIIAGCELNEARLMADVIAALPEAWPGMPADESPLPDGKIALVDANNSVIYQWGGLVVADDTPARTELPLHLPLSNWRLKYFYLAPDSELFGGGTTFNVISGIAVLCIAFVVAAIYFYREHTQAMREATQRVSFVNQVSHELKVPLTNIRLYAEMLETDLEDASSSARDRLGIIVSESQRLSRLIGNVLTFSRDQRTTLTLHRAPGIVDEAIKSVIAQFSPLLTARGVQLTVSTSTGAEVLYDRDAVEQILGNLLSNVEKYAPAQANARVESTQADGVTTIVVENDGPTIPPDRRESIFEPFVRLSNKLTDGVAGVGLGLTIARRLARLHGGDVVLDPSERGCRFRVTLRTPSAGDVERV